jgi:hypothetical protein
MQVHIFRHVKWAGEAGLRLRALGSTGVFWIFWELAMCSGIEFAGRRILWSDDNPQLPMLRKDGSICWGPWGKAFAEARRDIPAGGWARLESIRDGSGSGFTRYL